MKLVSLSVVLVIALISSCTSITDFNYGYAPAYRTLPDGFERVEIGGTPYWHHGGRFYQHDGERGYLLVKPPRGHEQVVAGGSAGAPAPSGNAVPTATQPATRSSNPIRDLFTPGGSGLKEREPVRPGSRNPARLGKIIKEE